MTILVTGARGGIARNVVDLLLEAGEKVRAASRDPQATNLPSGVEPVLVDFTKPETLAPALEGVDKVFLYAAHEGIDNFVAAAQAAGVRHVVMLSSEAAGYENDNPIGAMHSIVEKALRESGIAWTFLRPGAFATNALWWGDLIRKGEPVPLFKPETKFNSIHERDMAEVAVAALTQAGHEGKIYPLSGPELLSQRRLVETIAETVGKDIAIRELGKEEALKVLFPPFVEMLDSSDGFDIKVGPTAEAVTGKPARTFRQWARDHAADFQ